MATDHAQLISIRLDGAYYAYWAHLMTNTLKGKKLWKFVSTKVEKPTNPNMEEEWESDIGKINSCLANSVDATIGFQLARFSYPKDV